MGGCEHNAGTSIAPSGFTVLDFLTTFFAGVFFYRYYFSYVLYLLPLRASSLNRTDPASPHACLYDTHT
jgi:hypothetical protein